MENIYWPHFFSSEQEIRKRKKLQLESMKLAIRMEKRILDSDVTFLGHWNWLLSIHLIRQLLPKGELIYKLPER